VAPGGEAGGDGPFELFVNETDSVKSVELAGPYEDLDGNAVESAIELAPYSSRVLVKAPGAAGRL
jgi:hypothetical protein